MLGHILILNHISLLGFVIRIMGLFSVDLVLIKKLK